MTIHRVFACVIRVIKLGNWLPFRDDITHFVPLRRDLILGDDALLYIAYVMLIWAPVIPATRWSCSRPPADSNDC